MTEFAVEVQSLRRSFGRKVVLDDVSFQAPRGKTFAFLGRNGAGKTTTIRVLLGLLDRQGGAVSVLGLDPAKDALEIRRRVGYLAEDQRMFGWMRVGQLLSFLAPFYPTWDAALAGRLADRFEVPPAAKVRSLSKGQGVRLGLLLAMAHRPELVILDDPTLGLDPIMRKDFLRDVVGYLQSIETTVFFSSHLLYEIEPVADIVAILDGGRMVVLSPTEELRRSVKQLVMPTDAFRKAGGLDGLLLDAVVHGARTAVVVQDADKALRVLGAAGVRPDVIDLNLDDIFAAYVAGKREAHDWQADLERMV